MQVKLKFGKLPSKTAATLTQKIKTCHWHSDLCDFHYFFFCDCFWESVFRKSGVMHMVNDFKVAGKYWRGCRYFNSLHEYETWSRFIWHISRVLILDMMVLDEFFHLRKWNWHYMFWMLNQYFIWLCLTSACGYNFHIIIVRMRISKT